MIVARDEKERKRKRREFLICVLLISLYFLIYSFNFCFFYFYRPSSHLPASLLLHSFLCTFKIENNNNNEVALMCSCLLCDWKMIFNCGAWQRKKRKEKKGFLSFALSNAKRATRLPSKKKTYCNMCTLKCATYSIRNVYNLKYRLLSRKLQVILHVLVSQRHYWISFRAQLSLTLCIFFKFIKHVVRHEFLWMFYMH